ncbi:hypothetical protein ABZX85_03950 [Streptomyces sp. NPDC004539]
MDLVRYAGCVCPSC